MNSAAFGQTVFGKSVCVVAGSSRTNPTDANDLYVGEKNEMATDAIINKATNETAKTPQRWYKIPTRSEMVISR
ncbi:hypothetical protein TH9_15515 [Thalassospira xiamenensis]|nr:hypothetical protein TH9_15515 [Thalassospira xiamenensis]